MGEIMEKFDYAIIGQGAAAFSAAIKANEIGIKTTMIGKNETNGAVLGGTCINVGCVPSKRLVAASTFAHTLNLHPFKGIEYKIGKIDYAKIIEDKDNLVEELHRQKYEEVIAGLENVAYINEFGTFIDKNTVKAGNREISASKILIATGARASVPGIEGIDKIDYLTNETALSLKKLPKSIIIVGGRALGLEFAQMFRRFGSEVTVLQRSASIIPEHEQIVSELLSKYLKDEGVKIFTNIALESVSAHNGTKSVAARKDGKEVHFEAEELLFATGRKPNTEKLKHEKIGLKFSDSGFIKINEFMETNIGNIYAAGDVTGEPMLETVAAKEGNIATRNAFEGRKLKMNKNEIPKAIFTDPEVASVGLTENEVHASGIRCACNALPLSMVAKASILGDTRGAVKIVIDYKTNKVLGMHIIARGAADMIQEGVMAVKFGLTIEDLIDTMHVFPTLGEAVKLAAQSFYHDVSKMSCCTD